MRRKIVVIGDLNGADDALVEILRGNRLVDARLSWIGGRAELVQMGDLFNRGGGAVRALRLLLRLRGEARRAGGRVTVLLGNHEAMTALRHEGYCTEDEYLSFASPRERRAWKGRVARAAKKLGRQHGPRGAILPIAPRLEAWKVDHVPGRAALRRELGARGRLGKVLRRLPIVHESEGTLFVHAGLLPSWAALGIDGINARARAEWADAPAYMWALPRRSLFRDPSGPLWDRSLVQSTPASRAALRRSLSLIGAERMVVGHTQTQSIPRAAAGEIAVLSRGRLIGVDVGLGSESTAPRAALVIAGAEGWQWTPKGSRLLWNADGPTRRK